MGNVTIPAGKTRRIPCRPCSRARWSCWDSQRSEAAAVGIEDVLDAPLEQARDLECQGESGIVLAGLDGVDRLLRDLQAICKRRLQLYLTSADSDQAALDRRWRSGRDVGGRDLGEQTVVVAVNGSPDHRHPSAHADGT